MTVQEIRVFLYISRDVRYHINIIYNEINED